MDKTQQAAQLRLAADLLETGHPWETSHTGDRWWSATPSDNPAIHVVNNQHIRPVLATPPDGRPLQNPDNLTAEQVGVGYRLTLPGEKPHENTEKWGYFEKQWFPRAREFDSVAYNKITTYRLPLSVPWPDASTFQLPPPPPGMQWHREDGWKDGDLPQGYRPLTQDDQPEMGDECIAAGESNWQKSVNWKADLAKSSVCRYRTTRPLTFTHEGKQWTWHRPGDPMPCDGEKNVCALLVDGTMDDCESAPKAKLLEWGDEGIVSIIGWRYADEKKTVPLGPEDIHPFTRFRVATTFKPNHTLWITPLCANRKGIVIASPHQVVEVSYEALRKDYERNESLVTGKWNTDAWEPCSKSA